MNAYIDIDIVYNLYDDYIHFDIRNLLIKSFFTYLNIFYIRHCVYITCIYANLQLRIQFSYSYIYSLDILSFFDWKFLEISNFICIQIKNIFYVFHFPYRIKEVRVMRCATCICFLNISKQIRRQINVSGAQSSLL